MNALDGRHEFPTRPPDGNARQGQRDPQSFPAGHVSPEVWLVIVLLGAVALLTVVPLLPRIPEILQRVLHELSYTWSIVPAEVALLVTNLLFGLACVVIAVVVVRAEPVGRVLASVIPTSLAVSTLFKPQRSREDVLLLLCTAALLGLLWLAPGVAGFFARRGDGRRAPTPVAAAVLMFFSAVAVLGVVGASFLLLATEEAKLAVTGGFLLAATAVALAFAGRLRLGNPAARTGGSVALVAYAAIVLPIVGDVPFLAAPAAVAVAAVGLLWLTPAARDHFASYSPASNEGLRYDGVPARSSVATPAQAPTWPATRPGSAPRPARPRRRPASLPDFEIVHLQASGFATGPAVLDIRYDRASWFPFPELDEHVVAGYLVELSAARLGGSASAPPQLLPAFRGTSSLLITTDRLIGVCATGRTYAGDLDPSRGRVVVWEFPLEHMDPVQLLERRGESVVGVRARNTVAPSLLLGNPHRALRGRFVPSRVGDLTIAVNGALQMQG